MIDAKYTHTAEEHFLESKRILIDASQVFFGGLTLDPELSDEELVEAAGLELSFYCMAEKLNAFIVGLASDKLRKKHGFRNHIQVAAEWQEPTL